MGTRTTRMRRTNAEFNFSDTDFTDDTDSFFLRCDMRVCADFNLSDTDYTVVTQKSVKSVKSVSEKLNSAFVRLIRVVRIPIPSPINYHLCTNLFF